MGDTCNTHLGMKNLCKCQSEQREKPLLETQTNRNTAPGCGLLWPEMGLHDGPL